VKAIAFGLFLLGSATYAQNHVSTCMSTPWTDKVNKARPLNEYPRPQMVHGNWQNLSGTWRYAVTVSIDLNNNEKV